MTSSDEALVEKGLFATALFMKALPDGMEMEEEVIMKLEQYVRSGSIEQSKNGIIILSHLKSRQHQTIVQDIFYDIVENLSIGSERLLHDLVVLGQIALYVPDVFEKEETRIIRQFVVKELLMEKTGEPGQGQPDEEDEDVEDWVEYEALHEMCKAKVGSNSL